MRSRVLETYNGSDFGNEAAVLDVNFAGALCLFLTRRASTDF